MNDSIPVPSSNSPSRFPVWVLLGGFLLPLLYLPALATRFDFIDDGNLVYPTKPMPFGERAEVVWKKIVANYDHLGPFRPVLWVHWEIEADLLQGSEFSWRLTRLIWCMFAATMFLWLMAELGLPRNTALFGVALAMWNPYRNEIWTSLTLAEGVAMPYALLSLVCPRRALRSRYPIVWDILGACCVLAALGCKNTFAALIPAQMFLRVAVDGMTLREGWRRHGHRAMLLGLTILAPAIHFVYFKLHWHPGQYQPGRPTLEQVRRIISSQLGAVSADFMAAGLILAVIVQISVRRQTVSGTGWRSAAGEWLAGLGGQYRAAVGAGVLLMAGGAFMYLPMDAMSGRYSMPGVWGLDLLLAVAISGLFALPPNRWKLLAGIGLAVGLLAVAVAAAGKHQKFAAKAELLWQSVEWVEKNAPANARIAWICGDNIRAGLNVEEGIHFQWHLAARGRDDIQIILLDEFGEPLQRVEIAGQTSQPEYAIWDPARPGVAKDWPEQQHWTVLFWGGRKRFDCCWGQPPHDEPVKKP